MRCPALQPPAEGQCITCWLPWLLLAAAGCVQAPQPAVRGAGAPAPSPPATQTCCHSGGGALRGAGASPAALVDDVAADGGDDQQATAQAAHQAADQGALQQRRWRSNILFSSERGVRDQAGMDKESPSWAGRGPLLQQARGGLSSWHQATSSTLWLACNAAQAQLQSQHALLASKAGKCGPLPSQHPSPGPSPGPGPSPAHQPPVSHI